MLSCAHWTQNALCPALVRTRCSLVLFQPLLRSDSEQHEILISCFGCCCCCCWWSLLFRFILLALCADTANCIAPSAVCVLFFAALQFKLLFICQRLDVWCHNVHSMRAQASTRSFVKSSKRMLWKASVLHSIIAQQRPIRVLSSILLFALIRWYFLCVSKLAFYLCPLVLSIRVALLCHSFTSIDIDSEFSHILCRTNAHTLEQQQNLSDFISLMCWYSSIFPCHAKLVNQFDIFIDQLAFKGLIQNLWAKTIKNRAPFSLCLTQLRSPDCSKKKQTKKWQCNPSNDNRMTAK